MPTRPSTPYRWATNGGARTAPTLARQGTGWVLGEPIDPAQCNDIWGTLSDWVDYLADVVPASNIFEAEVFRVVDPAGPTTRGALTWTTIGGNAGLVVGGNAGGLPGIFFDNVTGYVKILQSTGPVVLLEIQPAGMVGPKAVADAVYGARFQYDYTDLLTLDHDFSPSGGGYTPIVVNPFVGAGLPASLVALGASHQAVHHGRLTHQLGHAQARVERGERVLEDHLHLQPSSLARRSVQVLQALAVPAHLARAGRMQARHHARQRGLAAARLAHQPDHLALAHLQVHPVHRAHRLAPGGESDRQAADVDEGNVLRCHARASV
jgi:hypothetical protein